MQAMGADGGGRSGPGGGIISGIKDALGLGNGEDGDIDKERHNEAERLVGEYAEGLHRYLEEQGRWEKLREMAADEA